MPHMKYKLQLFYHLMSDTAMFILPEFYPQTSGLPAFLYQIDPAAEKSIKVFNKNIFCKFQIHYALYHNVPYVP